jgi:hypothetical protein
MFDHHTTIERESRERYEARLAERANDRMLRTIRPSQSTIHRRVAQAIGRVMVALGGRLQRYGKTVDETGLAALS